MMINFARTLGMVCDTFCVVATANLFLCCMYHAGCFFWLVDLLKEVK